MEDVTTWLLEQTPALVFAGLALYWAVKRLSKAEDEKQKLAEDVIKLTILWQSTGEELADDNEEFQKEVLELLKDIKRNIED